MIQTIIINNAGLLPNTYYAINADESVYNYNGDSLENNEHSDNWFVFKTPEIIEAVEGNENINKEKIVSI